jgi:hypothetical protein
MFTYYLPATWQEIKYQQKMLSKARVIENSKE